MTAKLQPLRPLVCGWLVASLVGITALSFVGSAAAATKQHALVGITDPSITGRTPGLLEAFAPRWRSAGIDIASITADWREIAPEKDAKTPPAGFDGSDPQSPLYNWSELDRVVAVLRANKIEPLLTVTGPGPLWGSSDPEREVVRYRPNPTLFASFAKAVALRYGAEIKRYIVWYEPNAPANLVPQSYCSRGTCSPRSPEIYRNIFNRAAPAIRAADSGAQVYAGALAARGVEPDESDDPVRPVPWLRAFGCLGDGDVEDRSSASCDQFEPSATDGLAFHPDQRAMEPNRKLPSTLEAGLADTERLTRLLDTIQAAGGVVNASDAAAPIDLYYTEFGYQTNPPDVFSGVTLSSQDRWLQEAAKVVYYKPRVKLLGQYLWRDEPVRDQGQGVDAYSGGQSGLYSFDGSAKPAAKHFPIPFWATVSSTSRSAALWGQVRPGGAHTVTIQRRIGRRSFRNIAEVQTDAQGYFTAKFAIGTASSFRFSWASGGSATKRSYSSAVTVSPR